MASESQARRLYEALSACADLHPDPASGSEVDVEEGDGGGGRGLGRLFEAGRGVGGVVPFLGGGEGLPPPMPGSGGWITAENVGELFDEEGNWRGNGGSEEEAGVVGGGGGGGGLGEGAGAVRMREDEIDGEGAAGEGGEAEETKWRRTE